MARATQAQHQKLALQIGPFIGGMNTYSDPSAIADDELADCVNFEVSLDGSLVSRPPIQSVVENTNWNERIYLLTVANIGGNQYIIGSNGDGVWYFHSGTWTLITNAFFASAAVQYNDVVYILPNPNNQSIALAKWDPVNGYSDVSPANLKTMMGNTNFGGSKLLMYKGRLFIIPGPSKTDATSRLIFSDPGNPESYSQTTQFVDINPGDGQRLMEAVVHDDNLILFKTDSTYVFTFSSTPADAELIRINNVVGAQGQRCTESWENSIFVLHRGTVYEIVNYNFAPINIKVPFFLDTSAPSQRVESIFLSRVKDRLIVRWFNRIYVYHLRTRTWTRWESADESLHNFGPVVELASSSTTEYYAGSSVKDDKRLFKIGWAYNNVDIEEIDGTPVSINCSLRTKHYDLSDSFHFKRLHWWGVDALVTNTVTGTVRTIVATFLPSWGDWEAQYTWGELDTWGTLSNETVTQTMINVSGLSHLRSFYRFLKSVRFRQANFYVESSTDGSNQDGPIRVFSLTLVGTVKQVVSKGIN